MIGVLIVVYWPNAAELGAVLDALAQARDEGVELQVHLWHNDAGPDAHPASRRPASGCARAVCRSR